MLERVWASRAPSADVLDPSSASGAWCGAALDEDVGQPATSPARPPCPTATRARGVLVAKQELVVAGPRRGARRCSRPWIPRVVWEPEAREGDRFFAGTLLGAVAGRARALLTARSGSR